MTLNCLTALLGADLDSLQAKPNIILLDQPFAGIDPIAIEDIKNVLKNLLKKDIGILARAGFNFELSKRVLELEQEEFNKLIKII